MRRIFATGSFALNDSVCLDQRFADKQIVSEGSHDPTDDWSYDRRQPGARPIGQSVILKASNDSKQAWPKSRAGLIA